MANSLDRTVLIFDMDTNGKVTERKISEGSEIILSKTLVGRLYPEITLALVSVPTEILEYSEKALVRDSLETIITKDGIELKMVGSGGGAKNGKFYFADKKHASILRARFQNWPEALVAYFGILTSECGRLLEAEAKVLVVPDNQLGTNDCRGWVSERMFANLDLPSGKFYQFRLGYGRDRQARNGKGSLKVMRNDVADAIGADIIIPESSIKPADKGLSSWSYETRATRIVSGPIVLGIREVSRELSFASSYTVVQFATDDVLQNEVVPAARMELEALKTAWSDRNHKAIVELIGKRVNLDQLAENAGDESMSDDDDELMRPVEAALLADGSGELTQHPYIWKNIQRLAAKWAVRLTIGGGLHLPGFALADDGYLFFDQSTGVVVCASDWIPMNIALTSLQSARSLCVRYPVRMREDLLPMTNMNREAAVQLIIGTCGLSLEQAEMVCSEQLFLNGTYTLHSQEARKNGGDFDFDQICVIDEARYPMFVQSRFDYISPMADEGVTKSKKKVTSPLYSLVDVALGSMGNKIGTITNSMSSCIAAGREDRHRGYVPELQKEIDSLKHNTKADPKVLRELRADIPDAQWLKFKEVQSITELPYQLGVIEEGMPELLPTDKVGRMYNALRKDLVEMMGEPMKISQFSGLIVGHTPTQAMLEEARFVNSAYSQGHVTLSSLMEVKKQAVDKAEVNFLDQKKYGDKAAINVARKELMKARSAVWAAQKKHKEDSGRLTKLVSAWGATKKTNRMEWCQALHTVISSGSGSGAILFHAFSQEVVDCIADRTRGIRTMVATNKVASAVIVENGTFYRESIISVDGRAQHVRIPLFHYDIHNRKFQNVQDAK